MNTGVRGVFGRQRPVGSLVVLCVKYVYFDVKRVKYVYLACTHM